RWKSSLACLRRLILFRLEQKLQRFWKPPRPVTFTVSRSLIDLHQQTIFSQSRASQDASQFSHVVNNFSVAFLVATLPGPNRQQNPFRPLSNRETMFQKLPVGNEQRRTLQQQSSEHSWPVHDRIQRNDGSQRRSPQPGIFRTSPNPISLIQE